MGLYRFAAIKVLRKVKSELHYKEITDQAIEQNLIETTGYTPHITMNAQITTEIKSKKNESVFVRTGAGFYKLNPKYSIAKQRKEEQQFFIESDEQESETKSSQFIGKAGEHLVVSKLLFLEFNANIMSVDEGIDIVATKDFKLFNIQVKTANERKGKYVAGIATIKSS